MLSGIGPREELERHGISVRVDLPGVGQNLQDRYEVGVVNRMSPSVEGARGRPLRPRRPAVPRVGEPRKGVYSTQRRACVGVVKRSAPERALPDLFSSRCSAKFHGLLSRVLPERSRRTSTTSPGRSSRRTPEPRPARSRLRSADPRDRRAINFHYFEEGSETGGPRTWTPWSRASSSCARITARLKEDGLIAEEELPGEHVQSDDELREFVRDQRVGPPRLVHVRDRSPRDSGGVLGADFRVHGTRGLRVVDASVFPRIPGFFIVSAVYMVGEKAAEVMLDDAARGGQ